MFKALVRWFRLFFLDEQAFWRMSSAVAARVRSLIMVVGLTSVAFSEQIASYLPIVANEIKLVGVILSGVSVLLRAGDKTEEVLAKRDRDGT